MSLVQNPNTTRPTLSIRARPLALEAFKSKLGLAEKPIAAGSAIGIEINPTVAKPLPVLRTGIDPDVDIQPKARKKFKWRPGVSALPWPPAKDRFPLIELEGEPVPVAQITPQPDAEPPARGSAEQVRASEQAEFRARLWVRKVAFEAAVDMPESERQACELFCLQYRESIIAAFHRRLARADVVRAMRELCHAALRHDDPANDPVNPST